MPKPKFFIRVSHQQNDKFIFGYLSIQHSPEQITKFNLKLERFIIGVKK